jgi:hypothetical protein
LWIFGRIWYAVAYAIEARKRGPGFGIGLLSSAALWLIGGWGAVASMLGH